MFCGADGTIAVEVVECEAGVAQQEKDEEEVFESCIFAVSFMLYTLLCKSCITDLCLLLLSAGLSLAFAGTRCFSVPRTSWSTTPSFGDRERDLVGGNSSFTATCQGGAILIYSTFMFTCEIAKTFG